MNSCIKHDYLSPRWSGEIADCSLPMTMDTYSNCSYGCVYCFSQYQRGIGKGKEAYGDKVVRSINLDKIINIFTSPKKNQFWDWVKDKRPIQYGGLSDQFDEFERRYGVTHGVLTFLKSLDYPICFSTKSAWVFFDERYRKLFHNQDNWNMKHSIITLDPDMAKKIEKGVSSPQKRLEGMREYNKLCNGETTLRLRPFIVGVSDKTYIDLIKAAKDAGSTAVTTEFFCLENRSINTAKKHYETISNCCGFDIVDFYNKYSTGSGYLRLNKKIKKPYIEKMYDLCKKLNMRFYVSDAHFKEVSCTGCCCGMPDKYNFSKGNFSAALQIAKKNGVVYWSDIENDMHFIDSFTYLQARGLNSNSREKEAKFYYTSVKEYLRYLWNKPSMGQSPYKMFDRVLIPIGLDESKNIIYQFNPEKSINVQDVI